jgi:sugar lactone lactonase YvrE
MKPEISLALSLLVVAGTTYLSACGGGGGGGGGSTPPTGSMAVFAGNVDGVGNVDGTGAAARFANPKSVATDSAGNVYVADTVNSTIRKITPAGVVTTLAGKAGVRNSIDGSGAAANFVLPEGIATDSSGNIYVMDGSFATTIRKITPAGVVTTLAGNAGAFGHADGTGSAATFNLAKGIATDRAGNIYAADTGNHTIRKITPAGVVTTLAGTAGTMGSTDATGPAASFHSPNGVATDSAGNVLVADSGNSTIRRISPIGVVTTIAGTAGVIGSADGTGAAASFWNPNALSTDGADNVYVADTRNYTIRKMTSAGVVTTLAGTLGTAGTSDGIGSAASFNTSYGIAADTAGNVYVADGSSDTIRKVTAAGVVTTLAGTASAVYTAGNTDGTGAAARFYSPTGVATDSAGNVYVADTLNLTIRKITPAGVVSTLAGSGGQGGTDATGPAASFYNPSAVAADAAGNVYVADTGNHTIRKITAAGVVTTLAGTAGTVGSVDATGSAASFNTPTGIATDRAGNVYVSDSNNNTVRKITPGGVVTTLAGTAGPGGNADGTGPAASFGYPSGIAVDAASNVYVADEGNYTIRKITSAGVVTTIAGTANVIGSADGTGAAASFFLPQGLAIDASGNIVVADTDNNTIRVVTPAGVVTTLAGVAGKAGFSPGPLPGLLGMQPKYVAIHGSSLYLTMNNGVVVVTLP